MSKTYLEKLRDPRWQKLRLEALEAAGWKCAICEDATSTLHVHHRQYFKGHAPWEYSIGQLEVLCEACHTDEHEVKDPLLLAASFVTSAGRRGRDAAGSLVAGFCDMDMTEERGVTDPSSYVAGQVAAILELKCTVDVLLNLLAAVKQRDRWTVQAAMAACVADLATRADVPAPKRGAFDL